VRRRELTMGVVKTINPVVLSVERLESGTLRFWCDRSINPLLQRALQEEISMTVAMWRKGDGGDSV